MIEWIIALINTILIFFNNVFLVLILNEKISSWPILFYSKLIINFFFIYWFVVCKNVLIKGNGRTKILLYRMLLWRKKKKKTRTVCLNLLKQFFIYNSITANQSIKFIYFRKEPKSIVNLTYDFYYINLAKCHINWLCLDERNWLNNFFFINGKITKILLFWYIRLSKTFYCWNYWINRFLSPFVFNYKFNNFFLLLIKKPQSHKFLTLRYKKRTDLLLYNNKLI